MTIKQAAQYIAQSLPSDILTTIDAIEDEVAELLLDRMEDQITGEDIALLEKNQDTTAFMEQYLSQKIPNFYTLLDQIVVEYIAAYTME